MFDKFSKKLLMMILAVALVGGILCLSVLISVNISSAGEPSKKELASVRRIEARMALHLFETGKLILLDTHNDNNPRNTIIVGAIDIPLQIIDKVSLNLPKNALIACF